MDLNRLDASLRDLGGSSGRRDAVRSLSAVGMGLLAAAGLTGREAAAAKKKKKKKAKAGPAGPAGARGPIGPTGPTGPTGSIEAAATIEDFQNAQLSPVLNETATLTPRCPNVNSRVLGGGFKSPVSGSLSGEVTVNAAFPTARDGNTPEGFEVKFTRTGDIVQQTLVVTAFVKCTA